MSNCFAVCSYLNENQWKKYIDGNSTNQQLLDDNLLFAQLHSRYELKQNITKVSQNVKDKLEKGGLNIELDDLSLLFTETLDRRAMVNESL